MEHPILGDIAVRKAIAYALNRKDIIFKVYLNNAEATDVPIPSDSWLYDGASRIYDFERKNNKTLDKNGWIDLNDDGIRDESLIQTQLS